MAGSQLLDEIETVDVIATLEIGGTFFDRLDESRALVRVEIGLVGNSQLDLRAVRQIGGFIQDEPPAFDMCLHRLHR